MPETSGGKPIGLFGGTFDPIHFGHLRLAEEAAEHLGLARIRWIPAGQPGHREAPRVTSAQRLEMVRLAIAGNPRFELDASEVDADRPSYTVPTLERLRRVENLGASLPLVLLVGADAFAGLPDWHRWPELFDLAHIAVAHRPGFPIDAASLPSALAAIYRQRHGASPAALADTAAGSIVTFAMTQLDISATKIRTLLINDRSPRYLLPDAVIAYIQGTRLYSPP
ncbi:MAG: nicotinate-nucleotide adenylyltransferase [Propionivibrio sp.]|uniref:Probable nicotinate-nucleotide adenylyltransferase n=1 Tax=Candidatus Propionivibrio dominans TaxID=2954373 RepID=A0A9D7IBN6_9RHOO|nr:nicotinate-nucleotide adenylyltransferase [Candidatus Propionivibrio dominans]MBL0166142.1 nicotinate-nucleotide adenylyltransferase [Propionivibrio sp.]